MAQMTALAPAVLVGVLGFTSAGGSTAAAPAPVYGLNPANTNVAPYVGPISDPVVRWQIPHSRGEIDNPAIILDARGVLFAQSLSPVYSTTGQSAGININSARDSTPALDSQGNIFQWENGRMHAYVASGAPQWTGPVTNFSDGNGVKIGPDGTIYAGGIDNQLYAFSPQGQLLLLPDRHGDGPGGQPALDDPHSRDNVLPGPGGRRGGKGLLHNRREPAVRVFLNR